MSTELPRNRLATTDETGKRVYLYPAKAEGKYARRKKLVHAAMLLFFLILPWIRPNAHQLLLLDVGHGEYFFFGLHFRSHDAPMILLLLLGFTFLIGFITSVWGRVWCGWACPQTVFTEFLFRSIERKMEGNHLDRRALDLAPFSAEKFAKKAAKWGLFTAVSLVITHSFLAYFVGSRELLGMLSASPAENWHSFLVIVVTTAVILFDFGWFREQFCVIMCPYGRFQSVMLDSRSTVVGYDAKRGEPRRGAVSAGEKQGDCVDCFRCVTVCPTGIDIRRGLQMECIACSACIDACDKVMEKTAKPPGLIRYTSLSKLAGRNTSRFTLRSAAYAVLFLAVCSTLAVALSRKDFLEATVLRAQGSPYELLGTGSSAFVLNHFRLDISNQTSGAETAVLSLAAGTPGVELVMPLNALSLPAGDSRRVDFFLKFPQGTLQRGSKSVHLELKTKASTQLLEVTLVGPGA